MDDFDSLLSVVEQQGQAELFERALLHISATPGKKGQSYCDTICYKDQHSGVILRDYTSPVRNTIAVCLKEWRAACGDNYKIPDAQVIALMAMKLTVDMPDLVTAQEIPLITAEWAEVSDTNPLLPVASNDDIASSWMKRRRLEKAVRDSHFQLTTGGRKIRTRAMVERLNKNMQLADLSGANTNAELVSIDDILNPDKKEAATTFYSTGVPIIDRMLGGGYVRGYSYLHVTGSGGGKCLGPTEKCVTYEGNLVQACEIQPGDILLGPDSSPRKVVSVTRGREEMFKVTTAWGTEPHTFNRSHILVLEASCGLESFTVVTEGKTRHIQSGARLHITIHDYLKLSPSIQARLRWVLSGAVEFGHEPDNRPRTDPYVAGVNYGKFIADKHQMKDARFTTAPAQQRLAFLRGVLKQAGHQRMGMWRVCSKNVQKLRDIAFIARSLGCICDLRNDIPTVKGWSLVIDPTYDLNTKTPVLDRGSHRNGVNRPPFTIESLGEGDYYGFTLEGPDRTFLLHDFSVTHNTVYSTQMCANMSLRQDLPCLWISTEEPENEVYFRLLSNFCGIPHDEIRKKLPTGDLTLSPTVKGKFDMVVSKLRSHIRVKRWQNEDYDLKLDLSSEIKSFEELMGKPPAYIIFDWLGASSTELGAANGVRNALKAKSFEMDQVAKGQNISILFFMQAGEQFKGERFINQAHVDECKTCGFKSPAVIGWSFLPNKGDGTQLASNGVHQDLQFLSVGKSRFGPGGWFQFKRNFAIQRFEFPK